MNNLMIKIKKLVSFTDLPQSCLYRETEESMIQNLLFTISKFFLKKLLWISSSMLVSCNFVLAGSTIQSDTDFKKSIAALSAVSEGSKQITPGSIQVFSGHAAHCREDAFDFCNCCQDSGWGKDIHLAKCNQEEQQLGNAKELGTTVYLGRYCHKKVWHHCVEHKRAYCVFGSKLARIVETQGRIDQLHIGMGDAKYPNCRGLTPQEFQRIDFSKINFSEVYGDIDKKEHIEALDQIQARIEKNVEQLYQEGHSHVVQ